jgi:ribose transport system permease protein
MPAPSGASGVAISDVTGIKERSVLGRIVGSQAFWVTVALGVIIAIMSALQPDAFGTTENLYNITRNFSFIGIMALGMTAVIITGGIDLSVGSIMGVVVIVTGTIMHADYSVALGIAGGLAAGLLCGLFNGLLISLLGLSPFVVTLGTLAIARSAAVVLSENKMIYEFGHDSDALFAIGGGEWLGIANPVWLLLAMAVAFSLVLHFSVWGRHLFAVGGNEQAARLTGVPVDRVKITAYVFSALCAAIAGVMILGWQGSAINAVGTGYELRVIASTVIGGANLMGGEGGAFGAFIGAALIEVIRNSLLMAGVDSNWQGIFVGAFIILAVLLERLRGRKRD